MRDLPLAILAVGLWLAIFYAIALFLAEMVR